MFFKSGLSGGGVSHWCLVIICMPYALRPFLPRQSSGGVTGKGYIKAYKGRVDLWKG